MTAAPRARRPGGQLPRRASPAAAAALAALATLVACGTPRPPADSATPGATATDVGTADVGTAAHHDHGTAEAPPAPARPLLGPSIYVLDQRWTDQGGSTVSLADLAGRPRVIAMAYTSCAFACPRILARMKQLEAGFADLPPEEAPGFVLVSIDPERDTPERLAAFARGAGLDPRRWTLLSGPDDQVLELSVLLGVKYRATGGGEFSHANRITVLDAEGGVAARSDGLDADLGPLHQALERLVRPAGRAGVRS